MLDAYRGGGGAAADMEGPEDIYAPGPGGGPGAGLQPVLKRNQVLEELHSTEHNYVQVLQTINNVFKETLRAYPKIISKGDLRAIFLNVDELLDAHHRFLDEMGAIMKKTTCVPPPSSLHDTPAPPPFSIVSCTPPPCFVSFSPRTHISITSYLRLRLPKTAVCAIF